MIRLCDKMICTVERKELSREILYDFFGERPNDVLMVVNGDQTEGFITYESIYYFKEGDWEPCVIRESVVAGTDMWNDAKEIFQKYPKLKYLPVYNQDKELSYFCYQSFAENYVSIEYALKFFLHNPQMLRWNNDFPGIESVEIYDMNEYAFYLLEVLEKKEIHTVLHGEKWKLFQKTLDVVQTHLDTTVMKIYAEGTEVFPYRLEERDLTSNFEIFYNLLKRYVRLLEIKMQSEWDNFFLCRFPILSELSYITSEEEYRTRFVGGADGRELQEPAQREVFEKVNGLEPEVFYQKKEWEGQHIVKSKTKYYGDVRTIRQSEGRNTVWILGPCIVEGYGVLYDDCLGMNIDRYLKRQGNENYGVCSVSYSFFELGTLRSIVSSLPICKNDVIICIGEDLRWGEWIGEKPDLRLDTMFAERQEEAWFYNVPIHTNARGNERIAKEISDKLIIPFIQKIQDREDTYITDGGGECAVRGENAEKGEAEIKKYITKLEDEYKIRTFLGDSSRIGSIVMNCNPFTLGHKYLIEESAKKVDKLIIFVVEENRSYFEFEDRYHMVKEGVRDLKNVIAVPSGNFVLSYHTLPAYFRKEEDCQAKVDASLDINVFSTYIAPEFGIRFRFTGEEPIDQVTAQYNQQMRKLFSETGTIEFSEIPRKEYEGEVISASVVRREMEKGNWDKIKEMVPETTYEHLITKYGNNE